MTFYTGHPVISVSAESGVMCLCAGIKMWDWFLRHSSSS